MALGIQRSEVYGKMKTLAQEITASKYELSLIDQGLKRPHGRKYHEEIIERNRLSIRNIKKKLKTCKT